MGLTIPSNNAQRRMRHITLRILNMATNAHNTNQQPVSTEAEKDSEQKSAIAVNVALDDKPDDATGMIHSLLTIGFKHGKSLELSTRDLSAGIVAQALAHGLKQKLVDAAAISRDPETGRAATIETKFTAVNEVLQRLLAGEWNKKREGGGNSGGLLFRALCALYPGKTPDQIRDWLGKLSDKQKADMRVNPKVAAEIEKLRVADGDSKRGEDLLAELDGLGQEGE
jgi:hypothetical protein